MARSNRPAKTEAISSVQLREIGIEPAEIVLEPDGRNTAPAVAAAAFMASREDEASLLLVLPSDHVITDLEGFYRALDLAVPVAQGGALVTFGMAPSKVETGYGHIRRGDSLDDFEGCYRVARFVEKPEPTLAHSMLTEGGLYWNSGMFLFSASSYLEELERLQPEITRACRAAVESGRQDLDFFRLDRASFCDAPSISIDYAVMEHTTRGLASV